MLTRYWQAWSITPPPRQLQQLLDWLFQGKPLGLYVRRQQTTARRFQVHLRDEWGIKVSATTALRYVKRFLREHEKLSGEKKPYRGRNPSEAFLREHMPLFSIEGRAMPAERETEDDE